MGVKRKRTIREEKDNRRGEKGKGWVVRDSNLIEKKNFFIL